ncbi:TRAF3-interacting protein 1 isoform X12 [Sarcophilus harrisii]|uniref:TRAF3-interacting protein 1 isoform X12 n=1 Tax=Sarcophilus harrisii TaxID=9305 RepID=UPI001301D0DC|nr:TRAF3-interacting protein 1 isoform X12 [Sarcophilus harrisii]
MNSSVVKRTQDALGKVIKKPPLTEKLLSKPPFRYLHDIITEVIRMTGFMKGLYTDSELKSDNVKDKDAKISFLQKTIDVVIMVSGEPLSVKPARIVAGHEPERTNELLQAIGKCCLNKLSSDDAVKRVLAGEKGDTKGKPPLTSKSQEVDNKEVKEEEPRIHKEKEAAGTVENLSKKFSESTVKDPRMEMDREVDLANRVSRSLTSKGSRWRSKNSAEGRREDNIVSTKTISDPTGLVKEPEQQTVSPEIGRREANNNSASVSDGSPASVWHENTEPEPTAKMKGDSTSDAEGEVGMVTQEKPAMSENTEMPSELASGVPPRRIPRPGSARPAPPRIKRQESAEVLAPERTGNGKMVSNVIIDSQNSDDEEDSQFVVEAAPQLSEMPEMDTAPAVELEEDEKHGGLVKKILETKKDYEKLQQSPKSAEKDRPLLLEAAWKKEKDIVSKEIEKLRTSIQTLCRSALPLGKIMDYIQEDMDAMQNELQLWHSENKQHAEALQKEQSITDCAVEPLKAELVELEQLIKDQQDKICAVKANILKNEEKIQKMVYSINISSRR